jgi:ribonuclease G
MSNELIVNVTSGETRVAFLESGVLSELFIERTQEIGIVGNIYKGKVQRVLPGMNAAFVEIGQDKAAFLYVTDFSQEFKDVEEDDENEKGGKGNGRRETEKEAVEEGPSGGGPSGEGEEPLGDDDISVEDTGSFVETEEGVEEIRTSYRWAGRRPIQHLLKPNEEILVQVTRDPISTKGARITSHISIPGRFVVYMPTWGKLGISKRVESWDERNRLRQILRKIRPAQGGFIVRTASEGVSEEQLSQDVKFLSNLWQDILRRKESSPAPALIQPELDVALRALRDLYGAKIDRIIVDDPEELEKIKGFVDHLMPEMSNVVEFYNDPEPIFDHFGIEAELNRSLGKKVWLKSGGYLVIDQTEALTTIDVNTGRFTGRKNLEETILQNNLEAVQEIAYQLKIRNLGGIIILDLIDMERRSNREKVYAALQEALRNDRAKTTITKISEIGLIEMTRKRSRESLKGVLCATCPYCDGKGYVKSAMTVVFEIFRHIKREGSFYPEKKLILNVHPSVFNLLLDEERAGLEALEKKIRKKIELKSQANYHLEQFDLLG